MALRVWLPLNRDLRNQGLLNIPITNNSATFSNGCANVSAGSITFPTTDLKFMEMKPGKTFSVAFWINGAYSDSWLIACSAWEIQFKTTHISVYPGGSESGRAAKYTATINNNQWYHLAFTWDGISKILTLYVDGDKKGENTFTTDFSIASTFNLIYNYNRKLFDFRIYDNSLSKKEVVELARGCVLHYPMNDTLNESTVNLVPNGKQLGWNWSYQKVTEYPSGINPIGSVYKRTNADAYFGSASEFIDDYEIPNNYAGTYMTLSCWYYRMSSNSPELSFWVFADNGTSQYTGITTVTKKTNTSVIGRWTYASITVQFPTNMSQYSKITYFHDSSGLNDDFYITNVQIEKKDHATPYTPTGRNENLNTANWTGGAGYWTITSQTANEIKFTKTSSQYSVIAIQNAVLKAKLPINTPITISGYLYNGDTPYKTTSATINTQYNAVTVISWESRDDGYFRYTFKYGNLDSNWLFHANFFGARTEGDISYIRNMEWHIAPYLKDVSGFDNHSLITGSLPLVTTPKSVRYDRCMNIDNSGTNNNYANCTIAAPQVKSASFWVYCGDTFHPNAEDTLFADYTSKLMFTYNTNNKVVTSRGTSSDIIPCMFNVSNFKHNAWNHFIINHLGTQTQLFMNGVELLNPESEYYSCSDVGFYLGRRINPNTPLYWTGQVSDFRLFSRVLTQQDVDDLYKDSLVIDKSQNGFTYELNESDSQTSVDVKKNGQLLCKNYSEDFDALYLPAGTYVDTLLSFAVGDTCKAETFIKYDANGSGRDLMGFSGYAGGYWGVKDDSTWDWTLTSSGYTDADITKYNRIDWSYTCGTGDSGGNYKIGSLGYGHSVRNKTIYHVKLWKNGILERDLYPCSINNQWGLINGLTGTFYPVQKLSSTAADASLVSLDPEARIGKNSNVTFNEIHEF